MTSIGKKAAECGWCAAVMVLAALLTACSGGAKPGDDAAGGLGPEVTTAAMAAEAPERRGLFEISPASGPRERDAAAPVPGLPFGEVVRICDVDPAALGREVARSPGRGQFALHDTDPASISPRNHYLTGFKDGCARQFTASLALFGTSQVHEATRYNPLNNTVWSAADEAYEAVKTRICRVARGEFCPERRAKRIERDAVFLSVYRDFGGAGQWMEIFLHKGRLEAHALLGG